MRDNFFAITLAAGLAIAAPLSLAACHRHHREGPAERAGKKVDHAVDRSADKVGDAAHEAGKAAHRAGHKVDEALD